MAVLYGLIGLLSCAGCGETVAAPKSYVAYTSKDSRFACDYPQGWKADGGGNTDYSWAKFTKENAEIRIDADIAGSLMGDIAKSGQGMFGVDASGENAPVAHVHELGLRRMKEDYSNYKEQEPKAVNAGLGDGRRSSFTADQTFGGKLLGYRATFLGGDRRINVVCRCPASNWKTLKPAFEKVIDSVRSGGR
jgi:hypothetical protein